MAQTWFVKVPTTITDTQGKSSMVATFDALETKIESAFDDTSDAMGAAAVGVLTYKGNITGDADFVAIHAAGTLATGFLYSVTAEAEDVVTGQTFAAGDEIFWAGTVWLSSQLPIPASVVTADTDFTVDYLLAGDASRKALTSAVKVTDVIVPPATKVLWVDTNRVDTYTADGTILRPFTTVNAAVAVATVGTLINIAGGSYTEDVVLPSGVSLHGSGNSAVSITGDVTVSIGNPVSLRFIMFSGNTKALTINASCSMSDCYVASRLVVGGAAVVQSWNTHVIPAAADIQAITMTSTGKLQMFLGTIASTGTANAIVQTGGRLVLNTMIVSSAAPSGAILSTGGTVIGIAVQLINTLGGIAADVSANGAVATDPNMLLGVISVGNVVCGAKPTSVEGVQFISAGALSGTAITFRGSDNISYTPAVVADWSGTAPVDVKSALDRIAAAVGPIA